MFVVSLGELWRAGLTVRHFLSWEQMAVDVVSAVERLLTKWFGTSRGLLPTVLVVLGPTGAILVDRTHGTHLVFDPHCHQSDWNRQHPGFVSATPFVFWRHWISANSTRPRYGSDLPIGENEQPLQSARLRIVSTR